MWRGNPTRKEPNFSNPGGLNSVLPGKHHSNAVLRQFSASSCRLVLQTATRFYVLSVISTLGTDGALSQLVHQSGIYWLHVYRLFHLWQRLVSFVYPRCCSLDQISPLCPNFSSWIPSLAQSHRRRTLEKVFSGFELPYGADLERSEEDNAMKSAGKITTLRRLSPANYEPGTVWTHDDHA